MKNIYILFILSIFITSIIETMQATSNMPNNQDICYLSILSTDTLDLIAQYLLFDDFETKEEFIERTKVKIIKNIPNKYYYKDFKTPNTDFLLESSFRTAFCPNEKNIALLNLSSYHLTVINLYNTQLLREQNLEKKDYRNIALSRNTQMLATIYAHRERDPRPREIDSIRYIVSHYLSIMNLTTSKTQTVNLPLGQYYSCPFAFNKQGTDIIIHKQQSDDSEDIAPLRNPTPSEHIIFPIVNDSQDIPQKKLLQRYFQQKGICKNIANSKT